MSIPKSWKKVKFGLLAKEKSNRIDNPSKSSFERYVGLEHLDSGSLIVKRWGSTKDVTSAMKLFNKNDILFARRNTYLRRVSVAKFDGICSGDIIVIEPILIEIVEGFLLILMQLESFENRVISLSAGAFSKRIKWKQLAGEEILIPSKEEQKKMAELFWAIEDDIEKTENLITINEKLKRGLSNELLTKCNGYKKLIKSEIGKTSEGLELIEPKKEVKLTKFGEIIDFSIEKSQPPHKDKKYIGLEHIDPGISYCNKYSDTASVKSVTSKFHKGDILYGKLRPYLDKAIIASFDGVCSTEILVFNANKKSTNDFILLHLRSKEFIEYNTQLGFGTKMPRTSKKIISNYKILLFSKKEQSFIVKKIKYFDHLNQNFETQLKKLTKLKKKLRNELLSGNLRLESK